MKHTLIAILFVCGAILSVAGEKQGYSNALNGYSPDGRFYYAGFSESGQTRVFASSFKGAASVTKNVEVFDLTANTSKRLFAEDLTDGLRVQSVLFGPHRQTDSGGAYFRNVNPVADGPKKALVVLFRPGSVKSSFSEIWSMKQDGSELKRITRVGFGQEWHVDVKHRKIRVFSRKKDRVVQETFDW